jgi:hypothetical protein
VGRPSRFHGRSDSHVALAIGANVAVFQLLDRIAVRPLPVRAPYDLVIVQGYWSGREQGFSYPLLREMNARQNVVEGIFASGGANIKDLQIGGRTVPDLPSGEFATGNYFRVIGPDPQVGRFFGESDDQPGAAPVTVLSDRFWRTEFAGRTSTIGSTIRVNGVPVTIVGVARPEFFGERIGAEPALWISWLPRWDRAVFLLRLPSGFNPWLDCAPVVLRRKPKRSSTSCGIGSANSASRRERDHDLQPDAFTWRPGPRRLANPVRPSAVDPYGRRRFDRAHRLFQPREFIARPRHCSST